MQGFLDEEAEDDDQEDEDDEEDEAEEGYEQIIKEQEKEQRESSKDQHAHRELFNKLEKDDDVERIANYYKQRYSKNSESNRFGSSNQLSDTIIQQQLLPGFKYGLFHVLTFNLNFINKIKCSDSYNTNF